MQRRKKQAEKVSSKTIAKSVPMADTVGFMIRIHEGRHASAEIKQSLKDLGLNAKYDATFVKLDEEKIRK